MTSKLYTVYSRLTSETVDWSWSSSFLASAPFFDGNLEGYDTYHPNMIIHDIGYMIGW